jgi:tetratricopeptide (TPR) repeat protein
VLALNRDQIDDALAHLEEVVRINPRRASAHFAQAIAHAKRSEAEPAGAALRKAFQVQPRYLEEAKHTEVLLRLFSPDQLDQMAQEGPISATQPADGSESDLE